MCSEMSSISVSMIDLYIDTNVTYWMLLYMGMYRSIRIYNPFIFFGNVWSHVMLPQASMAPDDEDEESSEEDVSDEEEAKGPQPEPRETETKDRKDAKESPFDKKERRETRAKSRDRGRHASKERRSKERDRSRRSRKGCTRSRERVSKKEDRKARDKSRGRSRVPVSRSDRPNEPTGKPPKKVELLPKQRAATKKHEGDWDQKKADRVKCPHCKKSLTTQLSGQKQHMYMNL